MSLMAVCQKIKNHMRTVYKINQHDHDMVNLVTKSLTGFSPEPQ